MLGMRRNVAAPIPVRQSRTRTDDEEEQRRRIDFDDEKSRLQHPPSSVKKSTLWRNRPLVLLVLCAVVGYMSQSTSHRVLWGRHHIKHVPYFLSINIPNDPEGRELVWTNIMGTLEQLSHDKRKSSFRIYYDTTSKEANVPIRFQANKINKQCRNYKLKCHFLGHQSVSNVANDQADEAFSLNHLQHFCSMKPSQTVVFLQANAVSPIWQRHLQGAAMACAPHVSLSSNMRENEKCDVCGLYLDMDTYWQYAGNTFTASCDHVNRLVPVATIRTTLYQAAQHALHQRVRNLLSSVIYTEDHAVHFGLDQFAPRQWIASHPLTKPCSMTEESPSEGWQDSARSRSDLKITYRPTSNHSPQLQSAGEDKSLRMREIYHHAAGWLTRWKSLYPKVDLSGLSPNGKGELDWLWPLIADGEYWQQAVKLYGVRAADVVTLASSPSNPNTNSYTHTADLRRTSCDPESAQPFDFASVVSQDGLPKHAIFYNVWVANDVEQEHAINRVTEQLDILKNSGASPLPTIYYNIIGESTMNVEEICSKRNIKCHLLGTRQKRYEGDILESMQHYCRSHPSGTVSYLTSTVGDTRGNLTHEETKILWRHSTKAATSPLCQVGPPNECNVCGLSFYTLPYLFFPGEMFKADCRYVENLMSPREFEAKQTETATAAMTEAVRDRLKMTLFAQQKDFMGVDEFAMQHWITSHPSLKPCDLAKQEAGYWTTERALTQFQYADAPRQSGVPNLGYPFRPFWDQELRHLHPYARREYSYLAGHFFRWNRLYGELPTADSWVYKWFPEGEFFAQAAETHGAGAAFDAIVAPYVNTTIPLPRSGSSTPS